MTPTSPSVFDGLVVLDYVGVAAFAVAGALVAARNNSGLLTLAFVAVVSGLAGGTLRDFLIGAPTFWTSDAGYVAVCVAGAGATFAVGSRVWRSPAFLWLDALGLAVLAVAGAGKAAAYGTPPLVSLVIGFLAAGAGGAVRDVAWGDGGVLLRKEIYLASAVFGAGVFVLLRLIGLSEGWADVAGGGTAFGMRAGAIQFGWTTGGRPTSST